MNHTIPPDNASGDAASWEAIGRFLAGESAETEAEAMRRWLGANPTEASLVSAFSGVLDKGLGATNAPSAVAIDVDAALTRVRARMAQESTADVRDITTARGRRVIRPAVAGSRSYWKVGALAAAAVVIVALGTRQWRAAQLPAGTSTVATYSTPIGTRQTVKLPDGTSVMLAPGSRLTVAAGFGGKERSVTLDGAAYLTVVHDDRRPFTVHAGSAVIRDIGTAFSVKTVSGLSVLVSVREGVVSLSDSTVSAGKETVELHAGDRGVVGAGASVTAQRGAASVGDPSWSGDSLVFRDAALTEVQADLRRWYGVELVIGDSSLLSRTITNTSGVQESGLHVAQVIASSMGAELQQHGDSVILVKARARTRP